MKKIKNYRKQEGSSLIDLMVGLILSSITVLGIFTIYAQFEVQKRTTVQVGETTANATLAMYPIQQNAKIAGYGLNHKSIMGCDVKAYSKAENKDFSFTLVPVLITPGADNSYSDSISFMSGSSEVSMFPVKLTSSSNSNNANIKVENKSGFEPGDLILLSEPGKACNLAQVSGVQGSSAVVLRNTGNYKDPVTGETKDINYNKPGGLVGGEDYASGAMVINLGSAPETVTYTIRNNQLIRSDNLNVSNETIGDNIVLLKTKYGLDNDKNGSIDEWKNNIGANSNYEFLRAIKLILVARTPKKEQKVNDVCIVTSNSIINWDDEVLNLSEIKMKDTNSDGIGDSAEEDWACYRYRVIHSVVPMRNLIWGFE